jgi:6-phosphofructokinase 1
VAKKGNIIIGQSGGPTPVINCSLYGIISEAKKYGFEKIIGMINGIEGVLKEELIDLKCEKEETLESIKMTPGAALGSCRYMLNTEDPSDPNIKRIFEVFSKHDIRYFFYIGGNDSMDTADKINKAAQKAGYDLRVIGIPKTVDNDLVGTDHCPGFGSAVKYVATSVMEAGLHTESMYTSEPVTILVTVGRNTGWLPAASALARRDEIDAPHLIYFPEIPFSIEKFLVDVQSTYEKFGGVFIVTGEGLVDSNGSYLTARTSDVATDSFGHPELGGVGDYLKHIIEDKLGLRTRCIKLDICQQSAMHFASQTDVLEAALAGRAAVDYALEGKSGYMVAFEREPGDVYRLRTGLVELSRVANSERKVPRQWINEEGNFPTQEFLSYVRPLIQGEVSINIKEGLPVYTRLRKKRIK